MFSRAWLPLHIFPPLAPVACFPALGSRCLFSRPYHELSASSSDWLICIIYVRCDWPGMITLSFGLRESLAVRKPIKGESYQVKSSPQIFKSVPERCFTVDDTSLFFFTAKRKLVVSYMKSSVFQHCYGRRNRMAWFNS